MDNTEGNHGVMFIGGIDAGHTVLVTGNPDGRKKAWHVERP